jgi:hypothetical protein
LFIAEGGRAVFGCRPAPCGLLGLGANLVNLFRFEPQPFQEALMAGRVAALEQPMPLFPFRLAQADLLKHSDPFFYVYMVIHIQLWLRLSAFALFRHGHDEEESKV